MDCRLRYGVFCSIADIANWCWVRTPTSGQVSPLIDSGTLQRWIETIGARPAVQRGIEVPEPFLPDGDEEKLTEKVRGILSA